MINSKNAKEKAKAIVIPSKDSLSYAETFKKVKPHLDLKNLSGNVSKI